MTPSPHLAMGRQAFPGVGHENPISSSLQSATHPSLLALFPSSQASVSARTPSPHPSGIEVLPPEQVKQIAPPVPLGAPPLEVAPPLPPFPSWGDAPHPTSPTEASSQNPTRELGEAFLRSKGALRPAFEREDWRRAKLSWVVIGRTLSETLMSPRGACWPQKSWSTSNLNFRFLALLASAHRSETSVNVSR